MNYFTGVIDFGHLNVQEQDLHTMMEAVTVYDLKEYKVVTEKNTGFIIYSHGRVQNGLSGYYKSLKDEIYIFADARIYNAGDVGKKLGLVNENISVAELIYESYMKWGEECLEYFAGDFAFSLWDKRNKTLFCARDHIGMRQIFYFRQNNYFIVSSDLDAILASKNVEVNVNMYALQNFIDGYPVSYHDTFYENVFRIPPGYMLTIKNNTVSVKRYWYPHKIKQDRSILFEEAAKKFKKLFIQAVQSRVPTHTKIGAEVSGGLDSSSVYAVIKKYRKDVDLSSFSLRFGDDVCDEGEYIETLVAGNGAKHFESRVDVRDSQEGYTLSNIYQVNPHWPIFSTYTMSMPLLKQMADSNIAIGLTGQGGDQATVGNWGHLADMFFTLKWITLFQTIQIYRDKKSTLRKLFLPYIFSNKQKALIKKIFLPFKKEYHLKKVAQYTDDTFRFYSVSQKINIEQFTGHGHARYVDNNPYLIAEKIYGIEFRHPFFDVRLVEFMFSLPWDYSYNYTNNRINLRVLFREAMVGILPEKIRKRRDKAEFSQVIYGELESLDLDSLLNNAYLIQKKIVKRSDVEDLVSGYKNDKKKLFRLWRFVNAELFYKNVSKTQKYGIIINTSREGEDV